MVLTMSEQRVANDAMDEGYKLKIQIEIDHDLIFLEFFNFFDIYFLSSLTSFFFQRKDCFMAIYIFSIQPLVPFFYF